MFTFVSSKSLKSDYKGSVVFHGPATMIFDLVKDKKTDKAVERLKKIAERESQLRKKFVEPFDSSVLWSFPKDGDGLPHMPEWMLKSDNWAWVVENMVKK